MNYKGRFYMSEEVILFFRKVISFTLFALQKNILKLLKKKRLSQKDSPKQKPKKNYSPKISFNSS